MLSITVLPLLALLFPAAATLVCSALGRPWPRRPGFWAGWVLRVGLVAALADAVVLLLWLQPGGTLQSTLWQLGPRLPVTLTADSGGAVLSIMVLGAALVVSFASRERRPLASAALGLAVVGAVGAALAGDLLSLYIGLQLSALGGIGSSYARQPRAASSRIVWAAVADQIIGLVWLGAMVTLLHQSSTLQLSAIPTGSVSPALAGILLLPAVVRLAACGLIAGSATPGRPGSIGRSLDVADWVTVVAVPTALLLFLRVRALSGGTWPEPWFGTSLDLFALLLGVVAVSSLLISNNRQSALRSLLLVLGALVVVGFGQNTPGGTLLGLSAGLALEFSAAFLPRALLGNLRGRRPPRAVVGQANAGVGLIVGRAVVLLSCALGFGLALVGLDLALVAGLELGIAPALAYLCAVAGLVLTVPRLQQAATSPTSWAWPLWVPAILMGSAALLPGWVVTVAAPALAGPGTATSGLISAPDALVVLAPGLLWPGGYLILLVVVVGGGWWALRMAAGSGPTEPVPLVGSAPPWLVLRGRLGALVDSGVVAPSWTREVRGWYSILVNLADREVAERPVWLWLAAAAAAAWLLAEVVKL
ncbi:MAG: hypothetical protein ACRENX_07230 [Candidatus Dormibacteria bacterium]